MNQCPKILRNCSIKIGGSINETFLQNINPTKAMRNLTVLNESSVTPPFLKKIIKEEIMLPNIHFESLSPYKL